MIKICLDVEGVLVREIWKAVANATGIEELRLTTRDEPDYGALMRRRVSILARHGVRYADNCALYEFLPRFQDRLELPELYCHRLPEIS